MLKPSITTGLLLAVFGLAVADAFLVIDTQPWSQSIATVPTIDIPLPSQGTTSSKAAQPSQPTTATSVSPDGIAKQQGPDVLATITQMGFLHQDTQDRMFLPAIINDATVYTKVLLKDGDRAGLLSWTESGKVKVYYLALKEALFSSFTPAVTNLIDQTQRREGLPPRNYLTFTDTGISQEQIVFTRVRDRLYEIHIAAGQKDAMNALIEELTK